MDKKLLIEQIAENTYCSIKDFEEVVSHELMHMGLSPSSFKEEIQEFIDDKKRVARETWGFRS